jgi:hypothetical protein
MLSAGDPLNGTPLVPSNAPEKVLTALLVSNPLAAFQLAKLPVKELLNTKQLFDTSQAEP